MYKFPSHTTQWSVPLFIVITSGIFYMFDATLTPFFEYQENRLPAQGWRFLTAYYLHTNFTHYLLNASGVLLLWLIHGDYYQTKKLAVVVVFCSVFGAFGVYLFSPSLTQFVGLSGLLHGLFFWGAIMDIRSKRFGGEWLVLGGAIKIGYENFFGASESVASLISANVAVQSHLWGGLGGVIIALLGWKWFASDTLPPPAETKEQ